jgi:hypothetical protein
MWPPEIESVAALVRAAGIEARLEELPLTEVHPPAPAARADAYECAGRIVVALVPYGRDSDPSKVATLAGTGSARAAAVPAFPFGNAVRVLLERVLLAERIVWLKLPSQRHILGLDPGELARLTHAVAADLLQDG